MPIPNPADAPVENAAAADSVTPPPAATARSAPPEKRRLALPLIDAMARAARGSPSDTDRPAGPPEGPVEVGTITASPVFSAPSTAAFGLWALSNCTSWLASVRLTLERSGTPSAEK